MIVVQCSHPLTAPHCVRIEDLARARIDRDIDVSAHFDKDRPFAEQVTGLLEAAGLTPEEWRTPPILVNAPSYSLIVAVLLAYLQGLMWHFLSAVRLRPRTEGRVGLRGHGDPTPRPGPKCGRCQSACQLPITLYPARLTSEHAPLRSSG